MSIVFSECKGKIVVIGKQITCLARSVVISGSQGEKVWGSGLLLTLVEAKCLGYDVKVEIKVSCANTWRNTIAHGVFILFLSQSQAQALVEKQLTF